MKLDKNDLLAFVGLALLMYGLWRMYHPAAFVVAGTVVLAVAWITLPPTSKQ